MFAKAKEVIQNFLTGLIKGKPEPGVLPRPVLDKNFQSNVKGLYIIGDLAGAALIKTAAEQGNVVIEHFTSEMNGRMGEREKGRKGEKENQDEEVLDVVIAGAGTAGLSAAFAAHEKGLRSRSIRFSAARCGAATGARWRNTWSCYRTGSARSKSAATTSASSAANARATAKSASTSCSLPRINRSFRIKTPSAFSAAFALRCARWTC
ncbi:MAG: FAD-binding protein [bacterium]